MHRPEYRKAGTGLWGVAVALIFFTLVRPGNALAQQDLLFTHLTTRDGLSYSSVSCVFKDSRGFVWIGTQEGLNRYDAENIKIYRHTQPANTIAGNDIKYITGDHDGDLWVATSQGLSKIKLLTDSIQNFVHTNDKNSLLSNEVRTLMTDSEGDVWIGTFAGIDKYDRRTNSFVHYYNTLEQGAKERQWSNNISQLYQDKEGRIWVSTFQNLYLLNKQTGQFKKFRAPVTGADKFIDNLFTNVFEDHLHQLWVSAWGGGLKKFNPDSGTFVTYKWDARPEIASAANICLGITESCDRNGVFHLWLASPVGLGDFDRRTGQFIFYTNNTSEPNSISSSYVSSVYTDNTDLLWIGTEKGVNILDPNKQFFVTHRFNALKGKDSISTFGNITDILAEHDSIWVTTWYGNGLYLLNEKLSVLNKWHKVPPGEANPDNHQVSHVLHNGNDIWISTFHGLVKYNLQKKTYKLYLPDSTRPNSIPSARVVRTLIDSHGIFWVFFYRAGFAWFNPHTETFTRVKTSFSGPAWHNAIFDVTEDKTGNVWIACDSFLMQYNRNENKFNRFYAPQMIPGCSSLSFMNDSKGSLWVGTQSGISVIDPQTLKHHFITLEDGLQNDMVFGMQQDHEGRVWMATHNGLQLYSPVNKKVTVYKKDDGLEDDNMNVVFTSTPNGRFLLGGGGYITAFYPDSVKANMEVPPVVITGLTVLGINTPVQYGKDNEKQVTLSYRQNEFAFEMAVLNYTNPDQNTFFCKMVGFDNDWRPLKKSFVSYTNLDPGEYLFRVKGANNNGVMNEQGDSVRIIIVPPFWKTWPFRISVAVLLLLIVIAVTRYRINRIRHEEQQKTEFNRQVAELRIQALRAQMNPHFIFNSLNSVLACMDAGKSDEARVYLAGFSKLVRMILENFSKEKISLEREIESLKLYLDMESLRFAKDFEYTFDMDEGLETDLIQVPPMLVQPYIENALWHGLANSRKHKILKVSIYEKGNLLEITVEDNGIGREAAQQLKKESGNRRESVGLKNTEERLSLQNKQARVQITDLKDNKGNGSGTRVTITIVLP